MSTPRRDFLRRRTEYRIELERGELRRRHAARRVLESVVRRQPKTDPARSTGVQPWLFILANRSMVG